MDFEETFPKGTKVHVRITAKVGSSQQDSSDRYYLFNTTTGVTETNAWRHYLYLGSRSVTGDKNAGGTVTAEFDAEVTGDFLKGPNSTTQVKELNDTDLGYTHYLYIESPLITRLPEQEEEEEENSQPVPQEKEKEPVAFEIGTRIRVAVEGQISGDKLITRLSTTPVQELEGGKWTHFLYLPSRSVTGDKELSGTVKAEFDAKVAGDYKRGPSLTTQVQGTDGYYHYLYLDSASVTVLSDGKPAAPAPVPVPRPRDTGGTRIVPGTSEIESADVLKRIAELEDSAPAAFCIASARTGEQLYADIAFPARAAALEYLDANDYNVERFVILSAPVTLSADDQAELDLLLKLNAAGRDTFGATRWITNSVLLRSDDSCDESWARDRAVERLGVSSYQLDEWPLSLVDWSDAAADLLENSYTTIDFNGETYWGKNSE